MASRQSERIKENAAKREERIKQKHREWNNGSEDNERSSSPELKVADEWINTNARKVFNPSPKYTGNFAYYVPVQFRGERTEWGSDEESSSDEEQENSENANGTVAPNPSGTRRVLPRARRVPSAGEDGVQEASDDENTPVGVARAFSASNTPRNHPAGSQSLAHRRALANVPLSNSASPSTYDGIKGSPARSVASMKTRRVLGELSPSEVQIRDSSPLSGASVQARGHFGGAIRNDNDRTPSTGAGLATGRITSRGHGTHGRSRIPRAARQLVAEASERDGDGDITMTGTLPAKNLGAHLNRNYRSGFKTATRAVSHKTEDVDMQEPGLSTGMQEDGLVITPSNEHSEKMDVDEQEKTAADSVIKGAAGATTGQDKTTAPKDTDVSEKTVKFIRYALNMTARTDDIVIQRFDEEPIAHNAISEYRNTTNIIGARLLQALRPSDYEFADAASRKFCNGKAAYDIVQEIVTKLGSANMTDRESYQGVKIKMTFGLTQSLGLTHPIVGNIINCIAACGAEYVFFPSRILRQAERFIERRLETGGNTDALARVAAGRSKLCHAILTTAPHAFTSQVGLLVLVCLPKETLLRCAAKVFSAWKIDNDWYTAVLDNCLKAYSHVSGMDFREANAVFQEIMSKFHPKVSENLDLLRIKKKNAQA